jgi:hypothetical protein
VRSYAAIADTPSACLAMAPFVYVRRDGGVLPFAPLYMGSVEILEKHTKFFVLGVGGKSEVVSLLDHLKPNTGSEPVIPDSPHSQVRLPTCHCVQAACS